jgi:23S rRNA (cytosine1962-C5)-methyltransferase
MDPPSYGRGPSGEVWKIEEAIDELIKLCAQLLSDRPLFFLVNSYTTGLSPLTMKYMIDLEITAKCGGKCEAGEIALPVASRGTALPAGASARWTSIGGNGR